MQTNTLTTKRTLDTRALVNLAVLSALAFLSVFIFRIPVVSFLKYEPKDVFIVLAGFLYGPTATVLMSVVVSVVEMFTISSTGIIGCVMNIISTVAFAGTASLIYHKHRTLTSAIVGLLIGVFLTTCVMLLWNYLITPLYMGYPREAVKAMLVPVFLPYNLIKYGLNMAIVLLLYKPFMLLLRQLHLLPSTEETAESKNKVFFLWIVGGFLFITCVYFILVLQGVL